MSEEEAFSFNDIDQDFLDRLTEHISENNGYYLQRKLQQKLYQVDADQLREKLKGQIDDAEDIFAQLTKDMYYDQEVEISPHLIAHFRTIPSKAQDQAMEYARENSVTNNEYGRLLARRRLAYGLISQNDHTVSEPIDRSLYDILADGKNPVELLEGLADNALDTLDSMPETLVSRLSQSFGIWEEIVTKRIKETDHTEAVKN